MSSRDRELQAIHPALGLWPRRQGRLARAKGPNGRGVARACQGTFETADLRHRASRSAAQWIEGTNRVARSGRACLRARNGPEAPNTTRSLPITRDAVLLMAYGSPDRLDQVEAYYTDIRQIGRAHV